jgi:hypothetical protein
MSHTNPLMDLKKKNIYPTDQDPSFEQKLSYAFLNRGFIITCLQLLHKSSFFLPASLKPALGHNLYSNFPADFLPYMISLPPKIFLGNIG